MRSLFFSVLMLFASAAYSQDTFEKHFGGTTVNEGNTIIASDSGFVIGGATNSYNPLGGFDFLVFSLDLNGDTLWSQNMDAGADEYLMSLISTRDSGYVAAGVSWRAPDTMYTYIVKLNSRGDTLWTNLFNTDRECGVKDIVQTSDGGYVLTGYSRSRFNGDFLVMKIDSMGALLWNRSYGVSTLDDQGIEIFEVDSGDLVAFGNTKSSSPNTLFDIMILHLDDTGMVKQTYVCSTINEEKINAVSRTKDKGFILAGHFAGGSSNYNDVYLLKIDSVFNFEWAKSYGGSDWVKDEAFSVIQTDDGGYAITGFAESFGSGLSDIILSKTDSAGNMEWTRTFGEGNFDYGYDLKQVNDGGFVVTGNLIRVNIGYSGILLAKTDTVGKTICTDNLRTFQETGLVATLDTFDIAEIPTLLISYRDSTILLRQLDVYTACTTVGLMNSTSDRIRIDVYPNPFHSYTTVKLSKRVEGSCEVYDVYGRLIDNVSIDGELLHLDGSDYRSGIYFMKVDLGNESYCRKIVVR